MIFRLIFATIIAYLRHAIPSFKIATPHSQYLRHYLCGANHNRVPPARCSLRSPTTAPLGIPSARCLPVPRHRFRSPPSLPSASPPLATIRSASLPLAAIPSLGIPSARRHRCHSPGTAILDFGGDFGIILGIFGGNFGFRWQFWEVFAIFRWQFWENCLFLQCNNERQSLRGDNKAKGYHCAKIIK